MIFYDGKCPTCRKIKHCLGNVFEKRGFVWMPIEHPWVKYRSGISADELYREMKILDAVGGIRGGVDAWVYLAGKVWWMYPFYGIGRIRILKPLLNRVYRMIAAKRYCVGGTCKIGGR